MTINPPPFDEPPPGPPKTVIAEDLADGTPEDTGVLVILTAQAPDAPAVQGSCLNDERFCDDGR